MKTILKEDCGLTGRDLATITGILERHAGISRVKLFGSRAKGNFKLGSDVDLAIMDEGVSSQTMVNLAEDFEESTLPYVVDILNYPTLSHPELTEHINRVGIDIYTR